MAMGLILGVIFGIFYILQKKYGDAWFADPLVWLVGGMAGILIGAWVFG